MGRMLEEGLHLPPLKSANLIGVHHLGTPHFIEIAQHIVALECTVGRVDDLS